MAITVTMMSKMARHAPTSRARVIFMSHLWPMYQKSSPTRQLIHTKHTLTYTNISRTGGEKHNVCVCVCVLLPAYWKLVWVVCADAVVVAVVRVADRGAAVVCRAGLGHTLITCWALKQPVTHTAL